MKHTIERRNFLKYLGAVGLGSGLKNLLTIKSRSVEHLTSMVTPPKGVVPGVANWYASACGQCSAGCGINVRIREGRAKKIEGNAGHPLNKGKICARGQAGLQVLYNPDRIKHPLIKKNGKFQKLSWNEAIKIAAEKLGEAKSKPNKVAFISGSQKGSLGLLIKSFTNSLSSDKVLFYEFLNEIASSAANKQSFDYDGLLDLDIENTEHILSLGSNFLENFSSAVKNSVGYGKMRDTQEGAIGKRGHLTQFESRLTITGASADDWHPIKPHSESLIGLAVAHTIVKEKMADASVSGELDKWEEALKDYTPEEVSKKSGVSAQKIEEAAKNFAKAETAIAICGGAAAAQKDGVLNATVANILNHLVGSVGKQGGVQIPVAGYLASAGKNSTVEQMDELAKSMGEGAIDVAVIYNTNPEFNLPGKVAFGSNFGRVPFKISLSSFIDDTTKEADLILPSSNYLESWGDSVPEADSGHITHTLAQPVVDSLYKTLSTGDMLLKITKLIGGSVAAANPYRNFRAFLQNSWKSIYQKAKSAGHTAEATFETFWNSSVQKGGFWTDEASFTAPTKRPAPSLISAVAEHDSEEGEGEFSLLPYPGAGTYDGRGANQPWLQQLPEPLVTGAWSTWAEINPETAKELNVEMGDILNIKSSTGTIKLPAYIFPAIEPKTIAVPIGRGHKSYGRYAKEGKNVLKIIDSLKIKGTGDLAWAATKIDVSKGSGWVDITRTEPRQLLAGEVVLREFDREIVQWMDPDEYEKVKDDHEKPIDALPPHREANNTDDFWGGIVQPSKDKVDTSEFRWGMVIDLDKCTGCSACMVACYAENNLPIVPSDQFERRRHKNWIRVDRYWEGDYPNVRAKVLPANCQHCGKAPCEGVCPVYAAFHTKDGLNGQVYQRCVGTRYCNVGCPYKARIFNWFNPDWPKPLNMQLNTDISVRTAGITEKCTFCVQRIREAKDKAKDENRKVRDGEIQTACMQTCPSSAITFGNLIDNKSEASKLTTSPRRYRVLEELDTVPAVIYLQAVRKGAVEHKKKTGGKESESGGETH